MRKISRSIIVALCFTVLASGCILFPKEIWITVYNNTSAKITGILEVEGENPVAETAGGVVTGTAKTVGQTIEGAGGMIKGTGKVITAPIKALAD